MVEIKRTKNEWVAYFKKEFAMELERRRALEEQNRLLTNRVRYLEKFARSLKMSDELKKKLGLSDGPAS